MAISAVPDRTYTPKSFDREKYDITSYQYPSDLVGGKVNSLKSDIRGDARLASPYGDNYVIFYINVNNESRMFKNADRTENFDNTIDVDASERVKKNILAQDYAGKVQRFAKETSESVSGFFNKEDIKYIGGFVGDAVGSTFSRPQKRLKAAIALHVPNQLNIRYGAGWADEETFGLQAILEGGSAIGRALKESGKALSNNPDRSQNMADVAQSSAGRLSSIAANVVLGKAPGLSALSGVAPNPLKEQIFKGVDFRTFTMEYQFAPRDEKEAKNVLNIIQAFKYHMHPEYKGENNFLFLYPSEFDISYFHGSQENLNIHRHTSCVLTDMDINYTPNGNFSTFKGGMPTQINVSMSFKELTILTKELIQQGL